MVRDDIIEYSLDTHHNEEEGKKVRKKIYFVTILLSVITIVEVGIGIAFPRAEVVGEGNPLTSAGWISIMVGYIVLTLVKAGYIVYIFMHLGDEHRNLRRMILWPYLLFICYLIFIVLTESNAVSWAWDYFQ